MNAAALSGGAHAPISRIAHVPAAGTGAIHHEAILQALTSDQMQKHPSAAGERQMLPRQTNNRRRSAMRHPQALQGQGGPELHHRGLLRWMTAQTDQSFVQALLREGPSASSGCTAGASDSSPTTTA